LYISNIRNDYLISNTKSKPLFLSPQKEKVDFSSSNDKVDISFGREERNYHDIEKQNDSPSDNITSSKTLPATQKKVNVPLSITLDLNGKPIEKTIGGSTSDKEIILNLKHTNDMHGSMPLAASMIKPEEFWVDAGDAWQDYTFNSVISGGQKEVEMMNLRDCDIAIPGNHFYDGGGIKSASKLMENSNFPYISSNTKDMMPYVIGEVEGVKIAFVGVRIPRKKYSAVDPSRVKELEITDPIEAVKKSIDEVKAKGVNNVIVLSHLGLKPTPEHPNIISDENLAQNVPGIDLIIGGHTHTPTKEKVEINGTRIVQAGPGSHDTKKGELYLGDVTLVIDKNTKKITSIGHNLIPINREATLEPHIQAIENNYLQKENSVLHEKLGASPGDFTHEIKTTSDSTLGNMITDAMRKETGADIAILDSNYLFDKTRNATAVLPKGEITTKDLLEITPWIGRRYDISVETWNVKGEKIKELLEDGVNKLLSHGKEEGLYQVSGLTMSYNPASPMGKRVAEIMIGDKPVDLNKTYKLTTTYHIGNWNPIFANRNEECVIDGKEIRTIVSDYIKKNGAISPVQDGRIKKV